MNDKITFFTVLLIFSGMTLFFFLIFFLSANFILVGLSLLLSLSGILQTEGLRELGMLIVIVIIALVLSPLSLIPSFFICMKMAKWLREKHNWPIYHPRKLFALSILLPVGLIILFIIARTVIQ